MAASLPPRLFQQDYHAYLNDPNNRISWQSSFTMMTDKNRLIPFSRLYIDGVDVMHSMPPDISILPLEFMQIDSQFIRTVPREIGSLSDLRELYIFNTPLTSLPDTIGDLSNLEALIISGTHISSLPSSFSKLKKLHTLVLSYNRIREYPTIINSMPNIRLLDLSGNMLRKLPDSFPRYAQPIYLGNNPLPIRELTRMSSGGWPVYY